MHRPEAHSILAAPTEDAAIATADRAAVLLDSAAYFAAADAALRRARHSIRLVGWTFDPRTELRPQDRDDPAPVGALLRQLARERPELDIRLLIWSANALGGIARGVFPLRVQKRLRASGLTFATDNALPFGAAQHQKLLVIDDRLAFCSNDDITTNRWDHAPHLDRNRNRRLPSGRIAPPWHATTMMVSGPAARRVGDVVRARWHEVTGEALAPAPDPVPDSGPEIAGDPWPDTIRPDLRDIPVRVVRGMPRPGAGAQPGESKALFLRAIAGARRSLYIEASYLSAPSIRDALAERLAEPGGPEVVIINGKRAASFFDRLTMDPERTRSLRRLREADREGRLHAFMPLAPHGRPIKVHSKLMIADDRFLRLGSSNLANRSIAYDMECDLATELAADDPRCEAIRRLRRHLIGHFLSVGAEDTARAEERAGSIGGGIRLLDPGGARLMPFDDTAERGSYPLGRWHIGDPEGPEDAWRPWRRLR